MTCWRHALDTSMTGAAFLRCSAGVSWDGGVTYNEKLRRPGGGASAEQTACFGEIGGVLSFSESGNHSSQRLDLFVCSQGISAEGE